MDHVPVMADTVAALLLETGGDTFLDCTIGGGGHALHLARNSSRPLKIFAIDHDYAAVQSASVRLAGYCELVAAHGDFGDLNHYAAGWNYPKFDGIYADLGLSSMQLDSPSRGFSHRFDAPLDLRYDTQWSSTGADLINTLDRKELASRLKNFGGEMRAGAIAAEIVKSRPVLRTGELKRIVQRVCAGGHVEKSLARVFQAIRMAVNRELESLERLLPAALSQLRPGGRLLIISYESESDRRVKDFFRQRASACACPPSFPICVCGAKPELRALSRKCLTPSSEEKAVNPRSRSARLRAAEKL